MDFCLGPLGFGDPFLKIPPRKYKGRVRSIVRENLWGYNLWGTSLNPLIVGLELGLRRGDRGVEGLIWV